MILLRTPRACLSRMHLDYVERLVELDSDPDVMRYINGGRQSPREVIAEKLPGWIGHYDDDRPSGFWAIHLHEGDEFVGWVHLRPDRHEPEIDDLGYRLKKSVWGVGLATEMAGAMIRHTMLVWKRRPVVASCLAANHASRRVMEKCGMSVDKEFLYSESILPTLPRTQRHGIRYKIDTLLDENRNTGSTLRG